MTHEEWMRGTRSSWASRNAALRMVDDALRHYTDADNKLRTKPQDNLLQLLRNTALETLNDALGAWIRSRTDYRSNRRNQGGVVEQLVAQVGANKRFSQPEQAALNAIRQQRDASVKRYFVGAKVVSRAAFGQHSNVRRKSDVNAAVKALRKAKEVVDSLFEDAFGVPQSAIDTAVFGDVGRTLIEALGTELTRQIAEAIPLAGTVVSLCTAIYDTGKVCQRAYEKACLVEVSAKMPVSDARSAIQACERLLDREVGAHGRSAARSAAATGAGIATVLTAGASSGVSAGVSIGNAIAALIDRLYQMGRDYIEATNANIYIRGGTIGRDIFAVCPMLGAYYLKNASTSDIALCFVRIGGPGWMDDVEQLKKKYLSGVVAKAGRLIDDHRYRVIGAAVG